MKVKGYLVVILSISIVLCSCMIIGFCCASQPVFADTQYTITYVLDGGTNSSQNPTSFTSSTSTITLQPATKSGYKFLGWYKNSDFTGYTTKIYPSSTTSNLTLYAKFSKYISLPVNYSYTDYYSTYSATGNYINCYYVSLNYYYENLESVAAMVDGHSTYSIKTSSGTTINTSKDTTGYYSIETAGVPSYIQIDSEPYYTISYNLNGGAFDSAYTPITYYYTRSDLINKLEEPKKEGCEFISWFIDEDLTKTFMSSSFSPSNITLYAKWGTLNSISATITTTDYYEKNVTLVDTIEYYNDGYEYIYSSNYANLSSLYTDYEFNVYTEGGDVIPVYYLSGKYYSQLSAGVPSYIKYETPEVYSITYGNLESSVDRSLLYNYYTTRSNLSSMPKPTLENKMFNGWFLDENFETNHMNSSFVPHDITLYVRWADLLTVPVYYYDISLETPDYVFVGNTAYYSNGFGEYVLGYSQDKTTQLPYYLDAYNVTSYSAIDNSDVDASVYTYDGKLFARSDVPLKAVYIFQHYKIDYFVNGHLVFTTRGNKGAEIKMPTFVTGYIGENYDAGHIGSLTIGKSYAVYLFKGWSLTDTSDISWFNKESVDLIQSGTTYGSLEDNATNISLYGYMTFYGKTNAVNENINYDAYIESRNGIITISSLFSLDDLMQEHVTEISSGSQKTNVDKLLKYLKLDKIGSGTLDLIKKIFDGTKVSITDIWNSTFGKFALVIAGFAALSLLILNIYYFAKSMSKIQSNS